MAETASQKWLDRAYVQDLLRKGLRQDKLEVLDIKVEPATAAGDNYGSRMLRVHTTLQKTKNSEQEKLSFIIKMLPDSTFAESIKKYAVFSKEAGMFIDILPAIDKLLKKAYPEHKTLQSECYGFDKEHNEAIFFEDLRVPGFRTADRFGGGLDQQHTDFVLKNLAKLHAASIVHVKDNPEVKVTYDHNSWNMDQADDFRPMFKNAVGGYKKLVNSWQDGPEKEKFLKKLDWLDDNFVNEALTSYLRDDTGLNVLTHGDCWINNMMFKYEDNKPVAIKFVDFQLSTWNSPLIDLVYFTFTSQPDEVKFGDKDAFLKTYHDTFTETLERLNFVLDQPFTFEDLKNEYRKRLMHGLSALLTVYPITVCPPTKVAKLDDFVGDSSGVSHIYNNEIMDGVIRKAFPYFEKNNVI